MAVYHHVEGYDNFKKLIEELSEKKLNVFVLFSGAKDDTGNSWCPDCVAAEPVIDRAVTKKLDGNSHFVHVGIERSLWKDQNNEFRKDHRLRLTSVPTLMHWGGAQKLGDTQCNDQELVELLLDSE